MTCVVQRYQQHARCQNFFFGYLPRVTHVEIIFNGCQWHHARLRRFSLGSLWLFKRDLFSQGLFCKDSKLFLELDSILLPLFEDGQRNWNYETLKWLDWSVKFNHQRSAKALTCSQVRAARFNSELLCFFWFVVAQTNVSHSCCALLFEDFLS